MSNETSTAKDIAGRALKSTGQDLPDGTYPATVYGVGESKWIPSQFDEGGKREVFEVDVAVRGKAGEVQRVGYLLPTTEGGVHRRSNMYKMLVALAGGNRKLIKEDGELADGVTLSSFFGQNALVTVTKNDKGFPKITGFAPKADGLKYPTGKECEELKFDPFAGE